MWSAAISLAQSGENRVAHNLAMRTDSMSHTVVEIMPASKLRILSGHEQEHSLVMRITPDAILIASLKKYLTTIIRKTATPALQASSVARTYRLGRCPEYNRSHEGAA